MCTEKFVIGVTCVASLVAGSRPADAQTMQVTPFGGYRFGGDLYEVMTGTRLDIDGAASVGVIGDVFFDIGRSVTFIYSHQEAPIDLAVPGGGRTRVRLSVDHWHAGATDELGGTPRVRPFLTGSLGLTRFGGSGDSEMRFSMAASGGVKLMASPRYGARFDARVYAIFTDANASSGICGAGGCIIGLNVAVVWQAEFTAGFVITF
jgi:hypothetical protein